MFRHAVDAHPAIAIVNETQWLPRLFEHRAQRPAFADGLVTTAILSELFSLERFARLGITADEAVACFPSGRPVPYAELVGRLFDAHGRHEGKVLVGEKSPGYVRHLR